jgi:hypothetical protein
MERFRYRLSLHPQPDRFLLTGALLMTTWRATQSQPTAGIDLSTRTNNDHDHVLRWNKELCTFVVNEDGIHFDLESIEVLRIKESAKCEFGSMPRWPAPEYRCKSILASATGSHRQLPGLHTRLF